MRIPRRPLFASLFLPLALASCMGGGPASELATAEKGGARRTALAGLAVDNRTGLTLAIAFRPTAPANGEVVVGRVGAHSIARMAPVLAGEPVVLTARAGDGAELSLAPRSLEIGGEWTWVIPADAAFTRPERGAR